VAKIVGVHVRIAARKYLVGFAVLQDLQLLDQMSLPAPGDSAPRDLEELHQRAYDFFLNHKPASICLLASDSRPPSLNAACRAEGALLAAVGRAGIRVDEISGALLRKPSGLGPRATVAACVAALCADIGGTELKTEEASRAAAAIVAGIKRAK